MRRMIFCHGGVSSGVSRRIKTSSISPDGLNYRAWKYLVEVEEDE